MVVDQATKNTEQIEELEALANTTYEEMQYLKGVIQKQGRQILLLTDKVIDLTARSMSNNITISGLEGDQRGELCKTSVLNFLKEKMKMQVNEDEIEKAYRLGPKQGKRPRLMVIRCTTSLRGRIFDYVKHLNGVKNSLSEYYYVSQQYPEKYAVECKEQQAIIKKIKAKNADLPEEQQVKVAVRNRMLYINSELKNKHIFHHR